MPLVLLPLLLLPISIPGGWTPPEQERPVFWLLWLLTFAIGLPFFVLSTSAPCCRDGSPPPAILRGGTVI